MHVHVHSVLQYMHSIPDTWNMFFREKFTNDFSVISNFPLKNAFHVSGIGCTKFCDIMGARLRELGLEAGSRNLAPLLMMCINM